MNTTVTPLQHIPALGHAEAMRLAGTEYERFGELVQELDEREWELPTDCDEWNIEQMVQHVLGAMEANASIRETLHQMRAGRKWARANGRPLVDGLGVVQIRERSTITGHDLAERVGTTAPRAVKGRRRTPALLRKVTTPVEAPGIKERWSLGYLIDTIYTRDAWMHRIDISRATGRKMVLTAEHDGRIVADIVAEWGRRHGQAFTLVLTGPAGATFTNGEDGERLELDTIEFARTVALREKGVGLLAQAVPF